MPEIPKYKDSQLAEKLFPEFRRTGSLTKVRACGEAKGISIAMTTLRRMADWFQWEKSRNDPPRPAAGIGGSAESNIDMGLCATYPIDEPLIQLKTEVTAQKERIRKLLELSPEDIKIHQLYGKYVAQLLDIEKQIRAVRPERKGIGRENRSGLTDAGVRDIKEKILGISGHGQS